jgi:hypothetical protein
VNNLADVLKILYAKYPELIQAAAFDLNSAWSKVTGNTISEISRPDMMLNGRLVVIVKDSVWMAQLSILKGEVIKSINQELGSDVVKDIKFKVGRIASNSSNRTLRNRNSFLNLNVPDETLSEIANITGCVEDKDMKKLLKNIMKKSYLRTHVSGKAAE